MRRSLPFLIITGVLAVAIGAGFVLYHYRMESPPVPPPVATPTAEPSATAAPSEPPSIPAVSSTPTIPAETSTPPIPAATSTPVPSTPPARSAKGPVLKYGRPGAKPPHIRGDPGAPVVLEEFGDFECMPCSVLWPVIEKLEQEYGNRLVVVFCEHPLRMHRFAMDAARAAEAAGLQGKFWEMHDTLYRNRGTWVPATYIRPYLNDYAAELQLDVDRFKADMDGAEVAKRLAADWDRGESLGIDRTPVIHINGVQIPVTERNEKGLREAIDKVLANAPTQPTR